MEAVEIIIRRYQPDVDDPYIYSTWTRYCWYSPKQTHTLPKKQWFAEKTQEIKSMLSPQTVKIACFKNSPFVIAGYIVVKDHELKWMCIKKDFHNQGIDQLLMQSMKEKLNGINERKADDGKLESSQGSSA